MQKFSVSRRKVRGQGMTEYVIIVALIAIAAIGVYSAFGNVIKGQTGAMAAELGGKDGAQSAGKAKDQAQQAIHAAIPPTTWVTSKTKLPSNANRTSKLKSDGMPDGLAPPCIGGACKNSMGRRQF